MQGIVTMPSYHTVMAVLLTYAFRRTGLVGYGIATLNLVMLLSIPPIGGHYLVDMLAGGALALGAIAVQRAPRHGVSRILFGLRRETLVVLPLYYLALFYWGVWRNAHNRIQR